MTSAQNEVVYILGTEVLFLVGFWVALHFTGSRTTGTEDNDMGIGFGCGLAVAGLLLTLAGILTWLHYHLKVT